MAGPPDCIGTYSDADEVCNGDILASDPVDALPCAWRARCKGLKQFCQDTSSSPEEFVGKCPTQDLIELCKLGGYTEDTNWVHDAAPEEVESREAEEKAQTSSDNAISQEEGASAENQTKATLSSPQQQWQNPHRRRRKSYRKRRRTVLKPEILSLGDYFRELLAETFPNQRFAKKAEVVVRPGTFYALDRKKEGHYIRWYCTVRKGYDQGIACVKFKPRKNKVDITLPTTIGELNCLIGEEEAKKLNPRATTDGQFLTICRNIGKEGIEICMRVIRELADNGTINVPNGEK